MPRWYYSCLALLSWHIRNSPPVLCNMHNFVDRLCINTAYNSDTIYTITISFVQCAVYPPSYPPIPASAVFVHLAQLRSALAVHLAHTLVGSNAHFGCAAIMQHAQLRPAAAVVFLL